MKFEYQAKNPEGKLQVGTVDATDRESAIRILTGHGLFILSIVEFKEGGIKNITFGFLNKVTGKDVMIYTRQFATLMGAGVPLSTALGTLTKQTKNKILKEASEDIQKSIGSGLSLSQALSKYPAVFSEFYVNMIRSAEVTGRVSEVMEFLADYLEKQAALTSKIKNAMIYPAFMIIFLFLVVILMATFVFPQIESVFKELGGQLPAFTQAIVNFGKFVANWWWIIIFVLAALIYIITDYIKSKEGKVLMDVIILRVPVFNKLMIQLYVARFADSVAVLTAGGVALVQAIEISARTVGSNLYEEMLKAAAEDVKNGVPLSQAINKYPYYFPSLVGQMISVGETTGRIESLLKRISAFYTREIEDIVSNLVELIQPILMLVIGVIVGALFAAILMPVFSFIGTALG